MPVPVHLGGRRLDGVWYARDIGFSFTHRPLLISGVQALPPDFPAFERSPGEHRISLFQGTRSMARVPMYPHNQGAWFLLRSVELKSFPNWEDTSQPVREIGEPILESQTEPPHRVYWVCAGVLVKDEELQIRVPCWVAQLNIFVNADGLQTDLTGLSLVDSEEKSKRLKLAIRDIIRQLELEKAQLSFYAEETPDQNRRTLREDRREEVVDRLPIVLGPFRRLVAAGSTGPYEWRQPLRLKNWQSLISYDLEKLLEGLNRYLETLED